MSNAHFDLAAAAREEMIHDGFNPEFAAGTAEQLTALRARGPLQAGGDIQDLRSLSWSSIDNDSSRDLDQIEFAESTAGGTRVLIGIADVDSSIPAGSPMDTHASSETTTVYALVRTFPMLPEEISTDLTSLAEGQDRLAMITEMLVDANGTVASSKIYRALVRNQAQLTYSAVGAWLEGRSAPDHKVAASADLQSQLQLQDITAQALRTERHRLGALTFDRAEAQADIADDGKVQGISTVRKTRASDLIEEFMVAANEVVAAMLRGSGATSIRRVVRTPARWPRIVELAGRLGANLPAQPDSGALSKFLEARKASDPVHYADLSLSVIKLLGPGEYVMSRQGDTEEGHFGLAAQDYTHSTAPNRRFADLVTQRLIKAAITNGKPPYSDDELDAIAKNCTLKESASRKVERAMGKRVAAVALHDKIGQSFRAVVTGNTPKGVFVRVIDPPIEGRLMRGEHGVDVGDQIQVTLLSTDPQRGFIDFGR